MRTSPSATPRSPLASGGGSEVYLHSRGICWESPGVSGLWTLHIWGETLNCRNRRWGSLLKPLKPLSSCKPALCKSDGLGSIPTTTTKQAHRCWPSTSGWVCEATQPVARNLRFAVCLPHAQHCYYYFTACSWDASQSQISKGKKMFYGSPPRSC